MLYSPYISQTLRLYLTFLFVILVYSILTQLFPLIKEIQKENIPYENILNRLTSFVNETILILREAVDTGFLSNECCETILFLIQKAFIRVTEPKPHLQKEVLMKILIIGGTGTISTAISKKAIEKGYELYLINRGNRNNDLPTNIHFINVDINKEQEVSEKLGNMTFDVVCDFIAFVKPQLERDYRLFNGKTKQFIFISSASAYNKLPADYVINEGTTLANPYWQYSQNKIECEEFLMKMYRENGFPVTIVRPSHTYCEKSVPLGVHGHKGSWQVLKRMLDGKPVIIHGDGTSLWTMTDSRDFAVGFIGLWGNPHAIGEAFQITSDETLTWNQIYQKIADALGVELKPYYVSSEFLAATSDYDFTGSLIGDKSNSVVFDNTKLKRTVPEFKTTIRFDEGIKRTIDYVLSHQECQTEDKEFDGWCDKVIKTLEQAKKIVKEEA